MVPAISVLMAVWKPHPVFFPQALESVLTQTFSEFELIIVEDPSELSAEKILARYTDPRIRYFRQPRRTSLVEQKNRGLAEVRAPLVAIFDADDVCLPDRLETQHRFLLQHSEVDVLGSQVAVIDERGAHRGFRLYPLEHEGIVESMLTVVPLCHPSVTMRTDVLTAVGGYYETGYPIEDYDLWSRLAQVGARFANTEEVLLQYRVHPLQTKAIHLRDCIRGVLRVKELYWMTEMGASERLRVWAERLLLIMPSGWVYALLLRAYYHSVLKPSVPKTGGRECGQPAGQITWKPAASESVLSRRDSVHAQLPS